MCVCVHVCACTYICSRVCLCLDEHVYEHMIQVHVEDREQLAGVCSCWVKSAPHQTLEMTDSIVDCRLGLSAGWTLTWVSASTLHIPVCQEEPSCPLTLLPLASGASSSLYL